MEQKPKGTIFERMNDAFAAEIMKRQFPVDTLEVEWRFAARTALEFASPASLGINTDIFKKLALMDLEKDYKLSLFEFATLSNNLEDKSARQLNLCMSTYCDLIVTGRKHVKYYSETIHAIQEEVKQRISAEDAEEKLKSGQPVMGVVKAEA